MMSLGGINFYQFLLENLARKEVSLEHKISIRFCHNKIRPFSKGSNLLLVRKLMIYFQTFITATKPKEKKKKKKDKKPQAGGFFIVYRIDQAERPCCPSSL